MPFGLKAQPQASDIVPIIKYDAKAGRILRPDYDPDTREKCVTDITTPPPKFALDFGTIEIGYIRYTANGPDYRTVPEGGAIPVQPDDRDDQNRLLFRAGFRLKIYGRILDGLREWSSTAGCVLEAIEDLYGKFRAAPEAATGKIPIVELIKTIPVSYGRGTKASTVYAPCFVIVGWTDRVKEMGNRTVPVPAAQNPPVSASVQTGPAPQRDDELNDLIPF
jgi:hypothetical protein